MEPFLTLIKAFNVLRQSTENRYLSCLQLKGYLYILSFTDLKYLMKKMSLEKKRFSGLFGRFLWADENFPESYQNNYFNKILFHIAL